MLPDTMLKKIGTVVRDVRMHRGFRPRDLAEDAGVPLATLTALEAGKPGASTADVTQLAQALQLDPIALLKGVRLERPSLTVYLRHAGLLQDFVAEDLPVAEGALEQGRSLVTATALVHREPGLFQKQTFRVSAAPNRAAAQAGHRLAREVRRALQRPIEPIGDLRQLAEEALGIAVVVRTLRTARVTALGLKAGTAAAIVLSAGLRHSARSTVRGFIAHELGHVLFDPSNREVYVALDFEDGDRRSLTAEQRARGFAAELLLPDAGLLALLGPKRAIRGNDEALRMVAQARDHFGSTWPMTANHLCNLGYVDAERREWLEAVDGLPVAATYLERQRTHLPDAGQPSLRVAALVQEAHDQGLVIDAEARAMLGLDDRDALPWDR